MAKKVNKTNVVKVVKTTQAQKNNKEFSFEYEVVDTLVVLSKKDYEKGYKVSKELRLIKWNGGDAKYDLREWCTDADGNERPYKGISLSEEELNLIISTINNDK